MVSDAKALSARYGGLAMPVANVAGNGNKIVSPEHAECLRGAVLDATLRIVEGAGHVVHHIATERVVEAVEEVASRSRPALADQAPDLGPAAAGRVRGAA